MVDQSSIHSAINLSKFSWQGYPFYVHVYINGIYKLIDVFELQMHQLFNDMRE